MAATSKSSLTGKKRMKCEDANHSNDVDGEELSSVLFCNSSGEDERLGKKPRRETHSDGSSSSPSSADPNAGVAPAPLSTTPLKPATVNLSTAQALRYYSGSSLSPEPAGGAAATQKEESDHRQRNLISTSEFKKVLAKWGYTKVTALWKSVVKVGDIQPHNGRPQHDGQLLAAGAVKQNVTKQQQNCFIDFLNRDGDVNDPSEETRCLADIENRICDSSFQCEYVAKVHVNNTTGRLSYQADDVGEGDRVLLERELQQIAANDVNDVLGPNPYAIFDFRAVRFTHAHPKGSKKNNTDGSGNTTQGRIGVEDLLRAKIYTGIRHDLLIMFYQHRKKHLQQQQEGAATANVTVQGGGTTSATSSSSGSGGGWETHFKLLVKAVSELVLSKFNFVPPPPRQDAWVAQVQDNFQHYPMCCQHSLRRFVDLTGLGDAVEQFQEIMVENNSKWEDNFILQENVTELENELKESRQREEQSFASFQLSEADATPTTTQEGLLKKVEAKELDTLRTENAQLLAKVAALDLNYFLHFEPPLNVQLEKANLGATWQRKIQCSETQLKLALTESAEFRLAHEQEQEDLRRNLKMLQDEVKSLREENSALTTQHTRGLEDSKRALDAKQHGTINEELIKKRNETQLAELATVHQQELTQVRHEAESKLQHSQSEVQRLEAELKKFKSKKWFGF